jgi:hypothetical protein
VIGDLSYLHADDQSMKADIGVFEIKLWRNWVYLGNFVSDIVASRFWDIRGSVIGAFISLSLSFRFGDL